MKTHVTLVLVWSALTLVSLPVQAAKTSVLVLDVKGEVQGQLALQITSRIAQLISDRQGYSVVTMRDVKDVLTHEESKQLAGGCQDEGGCAAEISKLEHVDLVVQPAAGTVGADLTLSAALIDAKTAAVQNRVSLVVDDEKALDARIAELVQGLFGWDGAGAKQAFRLPEGKKRSFAILDLVPSGVDAQAVTNLTQILSAELKKAEGASVIGRDDIKAMLSLEADKQLLGCADDTSCLAEIGAALGVDYIVAGHIGNVAGAYVVSLRLISPHSLEVVNRVTESYLGVVEQLVGAVKHAARLLVGIEAQPGALALSTSEGDGEIFVDGAAVDSAGAVRGLAPGRHNLRIVKDDYLEWASDVYVDPGSPTPLNVELERRPDEWYESWIFWTSIAGAAVIAAGVGLGVGLSGGSDPADDKHAFGLEVGLPGR